MMNPILSIAGRLARLTPMFVKRGIYHLPWFNQLIRKVLNRLAPKDITTVSIVAGGLEGARLSLDMQTEKDYWLGMYEPDLQKAITDWVKVGQIVYDVGANIGYITLLIARAVGQEGHIFAFEALPANLERLRTNLALNGVNDRVTVVAAAVVDVSKEVRFLVGPSLGTGKVEGAAGREAVIYSDSIRVEGIALDTFVFEDGNPAPDLIKMDIEGGEVLAILGMKKILQQAQPLMFLELHGPEAERVVWEELVSCGYRLCWMKPSYPEVACVDSLGWKAYVVAIPSK